MQVTAGVLANQPKSTQSKQQGVSVVKDPTRAWRGGVKSTRGMGLGRNTSIISQRVSSIMNPVAFLMQRLPVQESGLIFIGPSIPVKDFS